MPASCIRVAIADDHGVVRSGLRAMLERIGDFKVVAEAGDGRAAVAVACTQSIDLVILDVMLPLLNGIEATRQIIAHNNDAKVLACAGEYRQSVVEEALRAGARGYLLKNTASVELAVAVRAVMSGEIYLSPQVTELVVDAYIRHPDSHEAATSLGLSTRERLILRLLAEGSNSRQISLKLNIGVRTVEAHRTRIMGKLNLRGIAELTKYAIREGITTLTS